MLNLNMLHSFIRISEGRHFTWQLLLCVLILAFSSTTFSFTEESQASKKQLSDTGYIGNQLRYYVDKDGDSTIDQVMSLHKSAFAMGAEDILNFGFLKNVVWIRWEPKSSLNSYESLRRNNPLLIIEFPTINTVDVFTVTDGTVSRRYLTGTDIPFDSRPIPGVDFAFPLLIEGVLPDAIYLRLQASNALILPIRIVSEITYYSEKEGYNMLWGAIYGLIALVVMLNICLSFLLRNKYYKYYAGYAFCSALTGASLSGHAFQFLWPERPDVNGFSIAFFTSLMIYFALRFSMSFLHSSRNIPEVHPYAKFLSYIALIVAISSLFVPYDISFIAAIAVSIFGPTAAFMGIMGVRRHVVGAGIYTSAWVIYLAGAFTYGLIVLGMVQPTLALMHMKEVGATLEIIILSIGIAWKFRSTLIERENLREIAANNLLERNAELEKINLIKDNFFSMITHELRTPINGVVGSLENARASQDSTSREAALALAEESADAMENMINDLLLYQELSAGDVSLDSQPIHLVDALSKTCAYFSSRCRAKRLSFEYQPTEPLPHFITIDGYKFFQILYKLLDNAVKFTDSGCIVLQISYVDCYPESQLEVTVSDTGIGIDKQQLGDLFKPLEQVQAGMRRPSGGMGMGLVLADGLTQILGGELKIDSTLECGTSFQLRYPAKRASRGRPVDFNWGTEAYETQSSHQKTDSATTEFNENNLHSTKEQEKSAPKVLIVEDNNINALMLKTFIKRLGYQYEHADNGAIALKLIEKSHFDIIFMDCQMPVMDGLEATRRIRLAEGDKHIPIIACTANSSMNYRKLCKEVGMDAFLAKPIKFEMVKAQIKQWVLDREICGKIFNLADFRVQPGSSEL